MEALKFVTLPAGHTFEEKEIEFLKTIDKALCGATDTTLKMDDVRKEIDEKLTAISKSNSFADIQKQLDLLFVKMETNKQVAPANDEKAQSELINKWLRAVLKRDVETYQRINKSIGTTPVIHGETAAAGDILVPELLLNEIARWSLKGGVARRNMRTLNFGGTGNERRIPTLLNNITAGWVTTQGNIKPKTAPTFGEVVQRLETLAAIVPMTEEIMEDTAIDLVALIGQLIGERFAQTEDAVFLAGNTGAGDPFNGVIHAAGVVNVPLAGAALTPGRIDPFTFNIPADALNDGKFFMHRQTLSVLRNLRSDSIAPGDGLGMYLVQHPTVAGSPWTIWGYPIELTDALPSFASAAAGVAGAPGAPFMFFANLNKTCVYGEKQGIRIKMLTEGTLEGTPNLNLAERDMVAMRASKRVGYVPVLPSGIAVITK